MKFRLITSTLLLSLALLAVTMCAACSLLDSGGDQKQAKGGVSRDAQASAGAKPPQQELDNANVKQSQAEREAKSFNDNLQEAKRNENNARSDSEKAKTHDTLIKAETNANNASANLSAANNNLKELQKRQDEDKGAASGGNSNQQGGNSDEGLFAYLPSLFTVAIIFCTLLLLGALIFLGKLLIDSSRERTEAYFAGVKKRQDRYAQQTHETLTTLNNRVSELQSEIRELRRSLQDDNRAILDGVRRAGASSAAYAVSGSSGYAAQQSPRFEREEPAFPAAAEEYLNKNRRDALVVKPDFQNGILVQDAEGQGEFMLVRDYSAPDELLYVIPRIGYFQTKQDFLTYYAKCYECARPSAGTVWIIQPAVVDRISGGWTLREKGELEVR